MPAPGAPLRDAAIPALTKALVSLVVLGTGFRALSDDDYARIVIAQGFAEHPSFDPSGTSWLPFPFWLQGSAMRIFGAQVTTARAVAFGSGVASIVLVWLAARWLGASRRGAILGALLAAIFPYSAWLGVAAVPELPTAALTLLGVAALSRSGAERLAGGVALSLACLSRYEPWPIAFLFAGFSLYDARASRSRSLALAGVLGALGSIVWLLHGKLHHGHALFFVARVSEYRRAIGAGQFDVAGALTAFPLRVVRAEPELFTLAVVFGTASLLAGTGCLRRHFRATVAALALLVFLVAGDLRDGAPTHHAERALLFIWLWLALLSADAFDGSFDRARGALRAACIAVPGLVVAPMIAIVRPWYAARDGFIDREAELAIGRSAAEAAGARERLAVATRDFGFYAVLAGFASPGRAVPIDDRDPRRRDRVDHLASTATLEARLRALDATWLVLEAEHRRLAETLGPVRTENPRYLLVRVAPSN